MKTYGTIKLEDSDGNIMPRTYKDYQLLYVGRSLDEIQGKVSRKKVTEAREKASLKRRLGQEGVSAQNVIRQSRRIGEIMKPRKKPKKKVYTWKFKRGDTVKAPAKFFRGTELSYKPRTGKIQMANSKYNGYIPAYNIKWSGEKSGIWYDKQSVEEVI